MLPIEPATKIPAAALAAFPPAPDALLSAACALVSDEMLVDISNADYGVDASKHLAALRQIRDLVRVPVPLE